MAFVVNRDQVAWRVADDEAVVIHSQTSDYFSLNQSGTWLWSLMDRPRSPEDLTLALGARYARAGDDIGADVEGYLDELTKAGLVLTDADAVPLGGAALPVDGPLDGYQPPQLVRFGNLETLILSGE